MNMLSSGRAAEAAVSLLKELIRCPSPSRDEAVAADVMVAACRREGMEPHRVGNNVWCVTPRLRSGRPTLLLNAHIDTVKPVSAWRRDPFSPTVEDGRLYGLGSNDCGGGLVSLFYTFVRLREVEDLPWNLVFLASAEEEVSGRDGLERALPLLPPIDCALVGEPTGMRPALAEKGLMVLDVTARGRSGHAAREEGVNAIYRAMPDMEWFRTYRFARVSPLLGAVKMSVTMVQAGTQHNVVPDECRFVVDVRANECYANEELLEEIRRHVASEVVPRSTRLNSSRLDPDHPLARAAVAVGGAPFGSPTLSDQALMPWPSLKMGPGDSARSHTADEYILLSEIAGAVTAYDTLLRFRP